MIFTLAMDSCRTSSRRFKSDAAVFVYKNPGRNQDVPFVVQVQSTRLDRSVGRVIVPLVRVGHSALRDHALTPHLVVLEQVVFADVLNMATLFKTRLADPLVSLAESDQDRIIQAIDEMTSRP